VDVAVRLGTTTRRVSASGRDIYAVTAPIVVEGVVRLLDGRNCGAGAAAPGEAFDAADVLAALADHPAGLAVDRGAASTTATTDGHRHAGGRSNCASTRQLNDVSLL
jgi:hypothetical protein